VAAYERDEQPDTRRDGGTLDLHHDGGQQPLRTPGAAQHQIRGDSLLSDGMREERSESDDRLE
jgi:hypothetical protein